MTPKVDRPGPTIPFAVFDASVARVAQVPVAQQSAAIAREATALGISPANWRARRSKRKNALKGAAPASRTDGGGLPPPDLLARARSAAAGGNDEQANGASAGADPSSSEKTMGDELSPELVVAATVFLIERVGRVFGAIYKLPPALVAQAVTVTEDEKRTLEKTAPLAMPWLRKQLALANDTAGLYLYLFATVTVGWSKVDTLGTAKAVREAQTRPHRWTTPTESQNIDPSSIEPSEILEPRPDE